MKKILYLCGLLCIGFIANAQNFVHPGLLQSREDLIRMKKGVDEKSEPIYSGYKMLETHPQSKSDYKMQGPMAMVGRNPTVGQGTYDSDANAAYQNAIMWTITGNKAYAEKSKEIVNAWSLTLKSITGRDAVLMAGLGPFKMVNAAEILRYTNSGWTDAEVKQAEKHFKEVIYPIINDCSPFANGNWDTAALKTMMAISIFCNDRDMFERSLRYYTDGEGDGRITNYIINDAGQIQESGRDQGHTQLGIAHLGDCSEMAWHQGLDLYGYHDNLLLKGFEYTAKYNLGNDVPFVTDIDRTAKYRHTKISPDRGKFRAVYEEIYNHYVNVKGIDAPYTTQAVAKVRPEPQGTPGADHVGFGTFFFTKPKSVIKKTIPVAPGGLIASGTPTAVTVSWVEPINAEKYTVKRSVNHGAYVTIASINKPTYTDKTVKAGQLYSYSVAASNNLGTSKNAYPINICAGLPGSWKYNNIGESQLTGTSNFDGVQFKIEGAGNGLDSLKANYTYTYLPLNGDGTLTARYVPQISSQLSRFGLAIRESMKDEAKSIDFVMSPKSSRNMEAPGWITRLLQFNGPHNLLVAGTSPLVEAPTVTWSRLTGYYWFKLQRKNKVITASASQDGVNWTEIGNVADTLPQNAYIGLTVAAGLQDITTIIKYDNVAFKKD